MGIKVSFTGNLKIMNKTVIVKAKLHDGAIISDQDLDKALEEVDKRIAECNRDGYKVVSVVPLTGSDINLVSHTVGFLIVFELSV